MPEILESRILFAVAGHCLVYEDRHRQVHGEKDQNPERKVEHAQKVESDHRRHGTHKARNVSQHSSHLSKSRVGDDITSRVLV